MERPRRPYSLQRRPTNKPNRHIYYAKFRDPETGFYRTAISTGKTNKVAAMNWADERLRCGLIDAPRPRVILVEELALDFWNYDSSPYIQGKLARGGTMSRGYADICAINLRKYILPVFGKRPLSSLKPAEMERWVLSLGKEAGISAATVNRVYTAFRVMLREAVRLGLIEKDPTVGVQLLVEKSEVKGILSPTEVRKLFLGEALEKYWGGARDCYVANLLAAATGMRLGEIRGLLVRHVQADTIEVAFSWEEKYGLKGAKWGSERIVPITSGLGELLGAVMAPRATRPDAFVFSRSDGASPVYGELFPTALYRALEAMGVDKNQREDRHITFHSWRHFFNSLCRGQVDDSKLRLVTGHKTVEMTERYTHAIDDDLRGIRKVQSRLLG